MDDLPTAMISRVKQDEFCQKRLFISENVILMALHGMSVGFRIQIVDNTYTLKQKVLLGTWLECICRGVIVIICSLLFVK